MNCEAERNLWRVSVINISVCGILNILRGWIKMPGHRLYHTIIHLDKAKRQKRRKHEEPGMEKPEPEHVIVKT